MRDEVRVTYRLGLTQSTSQSRKEWAAENERRLDETENNESRE